MSFGLDQMPSLEGNRMTSSSRAVWSSLILWFPLSLLSCIVLNSIFGGLSSLPIPNSQSKHSIKECLSIFEVYLGTSKVAPNLKDAFSTFRLESLQTDSFLHPDYGCAIIIRPNIGVSEVPTYQLHVIVLWRSPRYLKKGYIYTIIYRPFLNISGGGISRCTPQDSSVGQTFPIDESFFCPSVF